MNGVILYVHRSVLACPGPFQGVPIMRNPLLLPVLDWARRLRYPTLFKIVGALFVLDLAIPFDDLFPPYLLDELMLGLATLTLAGWKKRKVSVPLDSQTVR